MKMRLLARVLRRAARHGHRMDGSHGSTSHHHMDGHHHHHHHHHHHLHMRWLWRRRQARDGCERERILLSDKCSAPAPAPPPPDVPHGFLAVYAGRERKRFVIPTVYLNHPAFRLLLEKAREEYGFSQRGVLNMPFEVLLFERFLWLVKHGDPPPPNGLGIEELEQYYQDKYQLFMETIHVDEED